MKEYAIDSVWNLVNGGAPSLSDSEWSRQLTLLENQKLLGLVFAQKGFALAPEVTKTQAKKVWKLQLLQNGLFFQELAEIERWFLAAGIEAVVLKGMALVPDIYPDLGSRFMCDIDLLLAPTALDRAKNILLTQGFIESVETKWEANDFKIVLEKPFGEMSLVVELHSRLFFQNDVGLWTTREYPRFQSLRRLELHDQLVHLLGHLGYQHSCLMLHWFVDIDRFIRHHGNELDWKAFSVRLKQLRQVRSARLIFFVLKKFLNTPVPQLADFEGGFLFSFLMSEAYLWSVTKPRLRYLLVKHLCKDSWWDALAYDFLWLRARW